MDICAKFHGNPANSWDISPKNKNANLVVELDEKSGDHIVSRVHPKGTMNAYTKFHGSLSDSCWDILVILEPCC